VSRLPNFFKISKSVKQALRQGQPVVALESTVISHGLPYPQNLELARDMEAEILAQKAVPATIGIIQGRVHVGMQPEDLETLAQGENIRKISSRDYAAAIAQKASGGTTVAGTLAAAQQAGIKIFATGGIGGVHRQAPFDISADLHQLSRSPVVVVCAGAKSILELPATLEQLETLGVPVIGYQTDEFPAFFSRTSGLPVSARADSPADVAEIAQAHWSFGLHSAILLVVPPPEEDALPADHIESIIQQALNEAEKQNIRGQAVTPFLLSRVSQLSGGESLKANLSLLKNNARVAAQVAQHLYSPKTLSA